MLAEVIEHRAHQGVLAAEMAVDQSVVDPRARRDVTDRGCRGSAFGKQVSCSLQNRRDDLSPAQGHTSARRGDSCTNCSHVTTVPARRLRSVDARRKDSPRGNDAI